MPIPQMPYKILALAPFCGLEASVWHRAPLPVTRLELDQALATLKPVCQVPIARSVAPDGILEIHLQCLKDFHPDRLVQQQAVLRQQTEARDFLQDALRRKLSTEAIGAQLARWPQLPPMESVALSPSSLARVDAAVLVTDHEAVDYKLVLELVPLIIDTRGALRHQGEKVRQA